MAYPAPGRRSLASNRRVSKKGRFGSLMNWIKIRNLMLLSVSFAVVQASAPNQAKPSSHSAPQSQSSAATQDTETKTPDPASSYHHLAMAHMYEEMMGMYGRAEYATKAIDEYRLAIEADPSSEYLSNALAELYNRT